MDNKKIILGLVGEIASGKGAVAEYLKKEYSATVHRYSDIFRDILKRLHYDINRKNMQSLSTALRKIFGKDLLAKVITEDIKNSKNKLIVVDGIRRLADIKYLINTDGFILVRVVADPKIRYSRITKRLENSGDTKKTFKEFLNDGKKEADADIPEVMKKAEKEIINNNDLDNLYKQIDDIIKATK